MDVQPVNQQPERDDQEIAKVLAGINEQIQQSQPLSMADPAAAPANDTSVAPAPAPGVALPPIPDAPDPIVPDPTPAPVTPEPVAAATTGTEPALEGIKKDALTQLRPLVDKLNVSAEEKFDTYLLLIRSTDDKALIAPAFEAAKGIVDDARRAQALLDIIKEIDYLSPPQA